MRAFPGCCAALAALVAVLLLFSPVQNFSERENRVLAVWQAPTWRTLTDGSFFEGVSAACSDQFPFRTQWVAVRSYAERLLGKRESNGIVFGKDGYLIPKGDDGDAAVAQVNLAALQRWERSVSVPTVRLFVPRACDCLRQKLPMLFVPSTQVSACVAAYGGTDVELTEAMRQGIAQGEELWYRTDHHWTAHGAYLAYTKLAPLLGAEPYERDFFQLETVSESFRGSSHSASGGVSASVDPIVLYRYGGDEAFVRTDRATGQTARGFYDRSALAQKDQYRIYLGGNTGHLSIRKSADGSRPRLLVIKDSYANCLIPFLALHFDLEIVDLRYTQCSVSALIASEGVERVLIVQGLDTVGTDASLGRIT